jgi:hypothetical protein
MRAYSAPRASPPGGDEKDARDVPGPGNINAGHVEERLAEAGRVLLALPWSGCFPAGYRSLWPDQGRPSERRRVPTPQEITAMDEAYRWTEFIADQDERRLVLMRSLTLDDTALGTPRYVWSWRRLRKATGLHPDTLKARWGRGIDRIVRGLNCPGQRLGSPRTDALNCRSYVQTRR